MSLIIFIRDHDALIRGSFAMEERDDDFDPFYGSGVIFLCIFRSIFIIGVVGIGVMVIGDCLGNDYELSRLYAPDFSTEFRKASK